MGRWIFDSNDWRLKAEPRGDGAIAEGGWRCAGAMMGRGVEDHIVTAPFYIADTTADTRHCCYCVKCASKLLGVEMSEKDQWQQKLAADPITLGFYRHHGTQLTYVVFSTTVHEATGEILVHYFSVLHHTRWTRSRAVFSEVISRIGDQGERLRFAWWRIATQEELAAAAFGGHDEVRRVFGSPA